MLITERRRRKEESEEERLSFRCLYSWLWYPLWWFWRRRGGRRVEKAKKEREREEEGQQKANHGCGQILVNQVLTEVEHENFSFLKPSQLTMKNVTARDPSTGTKEGTRHLRQPRHPKQKAGIFPATKLRIKVASRYSKSSLFPYLWFCPSDT